MRIAASDVYISLPLGYLQRVDYADKIRITFPTLTAYQNFQEYIRMRQDIEQMHIYSRDSKDNNRLTLWYASPTFPPGH